MTRQVQRVAIAVFVLFAALFVNLNYLQVVRAQELEEHERNARGLLREYDEQRGSIVAGQGRAAFEIAESVETDDRLRYLRQYPAGELYAHVTGYYSFIFGRSELESSANEFLIGSAPEVFTRNIADLLSGRQRSGDRVRTTLRQPVQEAARDALGDRVGAVVALDPRDGGVLALWSSPSYDPDPLASHDAQQVRSAWQSLNADPAKPLLNRAVREWYPPGSTFKIVTAAAALESGVPPDQPYPDPVTLDLPQTTADIGNFGGSTCAGGDTITLEQALIVSCNTTFAQLGLDVGAEALIRQAEAFGFNADIPFGLPEVLPSRIPKELDAPSTAQSAIGQRDVRATPLQMAMTAGAIGSGGVVMRPRIVEQIEDHEGRLVKQYPPEPLSDEQPAVSARTAATLTRMMVGVVEAGSGTAAAIDGVTVAGKTGTAQTGEGRSPTVWFVGFAPAEQPRVAVAVVVPDGGDVGSEATGGAVAAPIAKAVMEAALDEAE